MKLCCNLVSEDVHGCTQVFSFKDRSLCILLKVTDEYFSFINVALPKKSSNCIALHSTTPARRILLTDCRALPGTGFEMLLGAGGHNHFLWAAFEPASLQPQLFVSVITGVSVCFEWEQHASSAYCPYLCLQHFIMSSRGLMLIQSRCWLCWGCSVVTGSTVWTHSFTLSSNALLN